MLSLQIRIPAPAKLPPLEKNQLVSIAELDEFAQTAFEGPLAPLFYVI